MANESSSSALDKMYQHGDRIMLVVVWLMFIMALGLASWYGTWSEAFVIGLPAALVPTALVFMLPASAVTRIAMGASFMVFSALHIHQGHGMIELHFGIFVLLAFLLYYRDWKPIIAAAAVIAVHHLAFSLMQGSGYPVYVFPKVAGISLVLVHAAYVVFESAILVYMAVHFAREAVQSAELADIGEHLAVVDGRIDLRYRQANPQSLFAQDFNHFVEEVNNAIANTQDAANHLGVATNDLRGLSEQANDGVQRQRNETDQVATAINEMTATVQEVSRHASDAANAASEADKQASSGSNVVNSAVSAIENLAQQVESAAEVIGRLDSDSQKIGVVLEVIKGIADQTNLLALNAAIEAARAGEQGRGFAVVADEVRTLASRTQKSTEEIQKMIEQLQAGAKEAVGVMQKGRNQAQMGVAQARQAGDALSSITNAVATINEMNAQIASAADEQSKVAEEINKNIVRISEVSESTADSVREAANSSESLAQMSEKLHLLMAKFNV